MSGETEESVSGWTVDTLRAHFEQRLDDMDRRLEERFLATEKAITKAEVATEKRFDGVNEFRQTLSDQASDFLNKAEYNAQHQNLIDRIEALKDRLNRSEGRGIGLNAGWVYLVAAVSTIGAIVIAANILTNR